MVWFVAVYTSAACFQVYLIQEGDNGPKQVGRVDAAMGKALIGSQVSWC